LAGGGTMAHAAKPILVVAGRSRTGKLLSDALERGGFDVVAEAHVDDALERVLREPEPAVIVVDLGADQLAGLEFRRVQVADARLRAIPTVLYVPGGRHPAFGSADAPQDLVQLLQVVAGLCARPDED